MSTSGEKLADDALFNDALAEFRTKRWSTVDGWTVFTDKQAVLDRFQQARASGERLSDVQAFKHAAGVAGPPPSRAGG